MSDSSGKRSAVPGSVGAAFRGVGAKAYRGSDEDRALARRTVWFLVPVYVLAVGGASGGCWAVTSSGEAAVAAGVVAFVLVFVGFILWGVPRRGR